MKELHPAETDASCSTRSVQQLADRSEVSLSLVKQDGLPLVEADKDRMEQVVTNLLSNAIKFSPPGGRVRIEASSSEEVLLLSVRDHGDGIAPKDLPRLFKKFQQIDSGSTRKVGGTGLGLVISKGIIEQLGGRIGVESVPGEGSTFWFTLPVAGAGRGEADRAA